MSRLCCQSTLSPPEQVAPPVESTGAGRAAGRVHRSSRSRRQVGRGAWEEEMRAEGGGKWWRPVLVTGAGGSHSRAAALGFQGRDGGGWRRGGRRRGRGYRWPGRRAEAGTGLSMAGKEAADRGEGGGGQCRSSIELCGEHSLFLGDSGNIDGRVREQSCLFHVAWDGLDSSRII
jgi:hypothetical protein